jgi:hypothetical protein
VASLLLVCRTQRPASPGQMSSCAPRLQHSFLGALTPLHGLLREYQAGWCQCMCLLSHMESRWQGSIAWLCAPACKPCVQSCVSACLHVCTCAHLLCCLAWLLLTVSNSACVTICMCTDRTFTFQTYQLPGGSSMTWHASQHGSRRSRCGAVKACVVCQPALRLYTLPRLGITPHLLNSSRLCPHHSKIHLAPPDSPSAVMLHSSASRRSLWTACIPAGIVDAVHSTHTIGTFTPLPCPSAGGAPHRRPPPHACVLRAPAGVV